MLNIPSLLCIFLVFQSMVLSGHRCGGEECGSGRGPFSFPHISAAVAIEEPLTCPRSTRDIWEHASLLYHGYEWQAAATTFLTLSQSLTNVEHRRLCLLNAALIQARLGDLEASNTSLTEAVRQDKDFILTTFLIGLVSCELKDHAKAEGCFQLCYEELSHGAIDLRDAGLDFVLDRETVHANLRAVKEADYRANVTGNDLIPLNGVPVECIFEAPVVIDQGIVDDRVDRQMREGWATSSGIVDSERLRALKRLNKVTDVVTDAGLPRELLYNSLYSPATAATDFSPSAETPSNTPKPSESIMDQPAIYNFPSSSSVYSQPESAPNNPPISTIKPSLELLQPTVHNPMENEARRNKASNSNKLKNEPEPCLPRRACPFSLPARLKRIQSGRTSEDARKDRARQHALELLEGTIRPKSEGKAMKVKERLLFGKPSPRLPSRNKKDGKEGKGFKGGNERERRLPRSPIRTENFFERVLGRG